MRAIDLSIEDIAFGGKGVGRAEGKVVFVPYVIEGELVSAEVVREKKQFAEAELIEVKTPATDRVAPRCPYFGRCGGCAYQHMRYQHQLSIKQHHVETVLRRIGKIDHVPMQPIVPSPNEYAYRNRVTVHVRDGVTGFYRRDSHRLIDIESCPISRDEVNAQLAELRKNNPRDGNYTLRAEGGPRIFTQTNDAVGDALRRLIEELVAPGQPLLIDAFCGAGFFAKALLPKFERVIGIDWDRFAIAEARKSATAKETYIAGDVAEELRKAGTELRAGQSLIVDPPATGLTDAMRTAIVDLAPATLIYVSCNPSTLARDLKELACRFDIESVTPLDMFPQTAEIEAVVKLALRSEAI